MEFACLSVIYVKYYLYIPDIAWDNKANPPIAKHDNFL